MSHVSHGNSLRNRLQVERLEDRRVLTGGMWHAWAPAVRSGSDVAAAAFSASDDSFEVANQMGSLHGQQRLSDSLGFGDRRDVFQFEIDSAAAEVALEIDGTWPVLSLQVYNDEGNLVGTKGSGSRLTLDGELTAGTYYAVVSSNSFFPVYYRLTAGATPKQTTPADSCR
ncbi:MAG: pre-peptidase C-terminal domain-containing protein [Pirellulaceae bacterium]